LRRENMNTFICYEKCTTCRKARKWLDEHGIEYVVRPIKEDHPTEAELKEWISKSGQPVRKFFNTSGQLYRSMGLKDRLASMTEQEMISVLASDGMMVKRPVFVAGETVLTGFREAEWEQKLLNC